MLKQCIWATNLVALLFFSISARADLVTTAPFTGDLSDGFETQDDGNSISVFGGAATLNSDVGLVSASWSFFSSIVPFEGAMFYGSAQGPATFEFQSPVSAFGAYFGTNSVDATTDAPDATANFYNMANVLISSESIVLGNGASWTWNGWQANAGEQIKTIEIVGPTFGGDFVQMDSMQASSVPEPSALLYGGLVTLLAGCSFRIKRRFA